MNLAQRLTAQKNARKNPRRTRAKTSEPVSPASNLPTKIARDISKITAAINSTEEPKPATHTPGPWETKRAATPEAFPQFGVYAENGNGHDLAHAVSHGTDTHTHAETEANARLIAAAPDLLAALRRLVDCQDEQDQTAFFMRFDSACNNAQEAIAKAEGRASE